MVCQRCIKVVKDILQELVIPYQHLTLGEVSLNSSLDATKLQQLNNSLRAQGFELLGDKNAQMVEKIKNTIIQYVHHPEEVDESQHFTFSHYLSRVLARDYAALSHLFSSVEGITIEKFLIHQKIEKVKELLKYGELNLTEIAYACGYSSVQYLSSQFKRVTGMSPREFKLLKQPRQGIDGV